MGCSGSKEENLPLVVRCRERRELIRAAANHRYALAAAHVSYFRSLKEVGDALRKFVDEELVTTSPSSSSSSFSSPSLTLPPSSKKKHNSADESSLRLHDDDGDEEESHLHISDSSSEDEDSEGYKHHNHRNHHSHGHDSGDDLMHHHHDHQHHVHKEKGYEDEVRHSHGEGESSSHYPREAFNGYGNGFGGGFVNDPFMNQYPYPFATPHHGYDDPYAARWDPQGVPPAMQSWYHSGNSNVYYMKKSAPATKTVVQSLPAKPVYGYSDSYWSSPAGYGNAAYGGNYGYFSMGSPARTGTNAADMVNLPKEAPPPPSPKASAWDFFNPFDVFDSGYSGYYSSGRYGYRSNYSSPDSSEVREREGIPDLEEETENEVYKEVLDGSSTKGEARKSSGGSSPHIRVVPAGKNNEGSSKSVPVNISEGSSRSVHQRRTEGSSSSGPLKKSNGSSRSVPLHKVGNSSGSIPSWTSEESEKPSMPPHHNGESSKPSMGSHYSEESVKPSMSPPYGKGAPWEDQSPDGEIRSSISLTDEKSSPEGVVLKSVDEGSVKKKGVTFEVEETSKHDGDSSKLSSVTILSPRGTRDLREVVAEIRDEFETASSYGKEVAVLLEVGKLPYQPSFLKVTLSRLLYLIYPSMSLDDPPSKQSAKLASSTMKSARSYFENVGKDVNSKSCNLSSTLDKLYAWEKKLYKEVKDEEKLRVVYEKQCRRLKMLDEEGADSTKIDTTRASIRRLLTKLDVSIKAIDAISSRIHKLRDEELQPQVAELIHGLTRMWKAMLKCHQKQFQAMMESKLRKLRANTGPQTNPTATTVLERELRAWCIRFNEWIGFQKLYVESLNGWLLHCLQYEPEQTPDGPAPFSPGRIGAPPIFIICNDWQQAMEAISEARVANAMNTFASSLRELFEKQDEEGRQRLKAEYLSKDYEKHRAEREKMKQEKDGNARLSVVPSDSGVSRLDDLKVDLDTMRHKVSEEKIKHKDAMKLVHEAASNSLQGGLVPIFKALENFTLDALKAHEHVRLGQYPGQSS